MIQDLNHTALWAMAAAWVHGLLVGWALWKRPQLRYTTENEE